ncbi:MAG: hypothetical protein K1X67_24935 [Fimbriimonadaceae bacterium]|nr:hypothetical protein [Fimbriimonadaceae bacterium]
MVTAMLLATLVVPQTFTKTPTDDVWVYPHASDPQKDAYLRIWGAGGKAVAGKSESIEDFSYCYLKFDLSDIPGEATLKEARLILTAVADPGWTKSDLKSTPLEARLAGSGFTEKDWVYESFAAKLAPGEAKESIFGVAEVGEIEKGKEPVLTIDLLAGPGKFADEVKAAKGKALALALTSRLDPSELGRAAIIKTYSKDGPEKFRPVLRLVFE